jgi:transposase
MLKTRSAYPAEFRRQMANSVWVGRDPTDLASAFEPSRQTNQPGLWRLTASRADARSSCRRSIPR